MFCRVNREITIIKVFKVKSEKAMMINRSNSNSKLHSMLNSTNETNEMDCDVNNLIYFTYGTIFLVSPFGNYFIIIHHMNRRPTLNQLT